MLVVFDEFIRKVNQGRDRLGCGSFGTRIAHVQITSDATELLRCVSQINAFTTLGVILPLGRTAIGPRGLRLVPREIIVTMNDHLTTLTIISSFVLTFMVDLRKTSVSERSSLLNVAHRRPKTIHLVPGESQL